MNPSENCEPAAALAKALDREDYDAARRLLHENCVYEIREKTFNGAEAIIALYRDNGEKGRQTFDKIEYESSVSQLEPGIARINYTDIVTHAGETIIHKCAQEISSDSEGKVTRIRHIDFAGEREAIEAFKKRHGWYE